MKIGPRYLRIRESFANFTAEREALGRTLANAPGVISVDSIESHWKGGHRVWMDVDRPLLDDFLLYMEVEGWIDGF
jgi:hypothetical protein